MVEDEDIELTLSALQANLPLAANQLVQMANDNGGRDNVSVDSGPGQEAIFRRAKRGWAKS